MTLATLDVLPWNKRRYRVESEREEGRSSYAIDRDRIVHSETFRDLQHKTQVQGLAHAGEGAGFRTRLNHAIEVAQLARAIAARLGGDQDLSEAIALAHDLGHPPFGHAGERALRDALRARGEQPWNANVHSLVVVDEIECAFAEFRGLDLTWATREGIVRHSTPFDEPARYGEFASSPQSGLESQIVDAADVLAYISHDTDDALVSGFLEIDELAAVSGTLARLVNEAEHAWHAGRGVWPESERLRLLRRFLVAKLLGALITDIAAASVEQIQELNLADAQAIRACEKRVVVLSPTFERVQAGLLEILTDRYYRSPTVSETDAYADKIIRGLFDWYLEHPDQLEERFRTGEPAVAVATFIASLNDRSATARATKLGLIGDLPA